MTLWFEELKKEKDACYHKVRSRYKKWPSAYASGALVQCRKVGAKNWGNSVKKGGDNFARDHVKMTNPEQSLVEERMHLKELSNDVGRHVPLARTTREGEEQDEMGKYS